MSASDGPRSPGRRVRRPRVRAPKRRLSRETEQALTPRQLEILDELEEWVLQGGFAEVTMAEIARRMECSLRTLYGIAPRKDELVLIILDRRLHRIGREAIAALETDDGPIARLRAYLRATNLAVRPTTAAFAEDFAAVPGAREVNEAHTEYIVSVTRALLDEAAAAGEIGAVDTVAVAHVLGRLGDQFSRVDAGGRRAASPQEAADAVADLLFAGLEQTRAAG